MAMDGSSSAAAPKQKSQREVSTIGFPYADMEDGVEVARAILDLGGRLCARDQIAQKMNLKAESGNFTIKVGAARMFGFVETVMGKYQVSQLGHAVLDSDEPRQRAAKVEAFLSVPLYRKVYDEFRNKLLPPRPLGLEQAFVGFGVSAKQKEKARQVFDRSARQAGFYASGQDRLVSPVVASLTPRTDAKPAEDKPMTKPARDEKEERHPFIEGLLQTLPPPGEPWTIAEQAKWLDAAARIFGLIYRTDGGELDVRPRAQPMAQPPFLKS
jgi:hypothetical protein